MGIICMGYITNMFFTLNKLDRCAWSTWKELQIPVPINSKSHQISFKECWTIYIILKLLTTSASQCEFYTNLSSNPDSLQAKTLVKIHLCLSYTFIYLLYTISVDIILRIPVLQMKVTMLDESLSLPTLFVSLNYTALLKKEKKIGGHPGEQDV